MIIITAKAIYDNKLLECYFTRSFYKHILGILVKHTDMESEDYSFYKGLVYLTEHNIADLGYELTFSTEVNSISHLLTLAYCDMVNTIVMCVISQFTFLGKRIRCE